MEKVRVETVGGELICVAELADNLWTRGAGLLGRTGLAAGTGLLIAPCTSVHTWFMRFPIDVVFLDKNDVILKVASMPAWRMALSGRGAKRVLELPLGAASRDKLAPGVPLHIAREIEAVLERAA